MATVRIPSSEALRNTRIAISDRLATRSFLNVSIFGDPQSLDNEAPERIQIRVQADLKPAMERGRGLLWVQGPRRADHICRTPRIVQPTTTIHCGQAARKSGHRFFEYQPAAKSHQLRQSPPRTPRKCQFSRLFAHFRHVAIATPPIFSDTEERQILQTRHQFRENQSGVAFFWRTAGR